MATQEAARNDLAPPVRSAATLIAPPPPASQSDSCENVAVGSRSTVGGDGSVAGVGALGVAKVVVATVGPPPELSDGSSEARQAPSSQSASTSTVIMERDRQGRIDLPHSHTRCNV